MGVKGKSASPRHPAGFSKFTVQPALNFASMPAQQALQPGDPLVEDCVDVPLLLSRLPLFRDQALLFPDAALLFLDDLVRPVTMSMALIPFRSVSQQHQLGEGS